MDSRTDLSRPSNLFFSHFYFFVWLCRALLWHAGSSPMTGDGSRAPCMGSVQSQPRDHQGTPPDCFFSQRLERMCQVHLGFQTRETRDTEARDLRSDRISHARLLDVALPWLWLTGVRGSVSLPAEA